MDRSDLNLTLAVLGFFAGIGADAELLLSCLTGILVGRATR